MTSFASYFLISCALLYAFAYPFWTEVSMKIQEKEKYQKTIEEVNSLNQKKDQLLAQIKNIDEEDKKRIDTFMPTSLDFVKLTSDINDVGSKYGIKVDKVSSIEKDKSVGNSINEAQPPKPYNTASISFSVTTSYQNFIKFIGDLERSLRVLDIKNIVINPLQGGNFDFKIEMDTYWTE